MNVINSIDEFISGFQDFSSGKLKEKEDIFSLIRVCANDNFDVMNDLAFTAKYCQGLFKVLSGTSANPEINNIEELKKELAQNLEKCSSILENIINRTDYQQVYKEKYLSMSPESFSNFKNLLGDLDWLKMYLNEMKRTQ